MTQENRQQQSRQVAERSVLQSERGTTTIQDVVVAKVAGMAAQEVEGVHMGGGAARAFGGITERVTGAATQARGVSVQVGQVETAIDLTMAVDYGRAIPQVADAVRRNIINRVESLVGLRVTEVNITVNDVLLPQEQAGASAPAEEEQPRVR